MRLVFLSLFLFISTAFADAREFRVEAFCAGEQPNVKVCVDDIEKSLHLLNHQLAGAAHFKLVAVRETPGDIHADAPLPLLVVNAVTRGIIKEDGVDLGIALFPDSDTDNVRGISFLGTLGVEPATLFARATKGRLTVDVIAHEIGHSLGAAHDTTGLMTPALSDPRHTNRLSHTSLKQILDHLSDISPS